MSVNKIRIKLNKIRILNKNEINKKVDKNNVR